MNDYLDPNLYYIGPIKKDDAKKLIVVNHYSHAWTSCRYALGIFKKSKDDIFFDGSGDRIIGTLIYGFPIGRQVINGLSDLLTNENVLELTRLWIEDGHGKNIESWSISQSFKWLKKHDVNIKVLVSYADPSQGHLGKIYQATNWLYQKIENTPDECDYLISFEPPPNCKWIHTRTIGAKLGGVRNKAIIEEKIQKPYWKRFNRRKFRYIYILTDKCEKKKIISSLKHPTSDYPKQLEYKDDIIKVE
jgi:hypothetical protein